MDFTGEHLLPGQIGHFFVITALVAALLSCVGYYLATRLPVDHPEKQIYIRFSSVWFIIHLISILAVFSCLFYICYHHYFEYHYAFKHTSKELLPKYLLASIWEGQEGSFLLWTIWHALLGLLFIITQRRKSNTWEAPVMAFICSAQVFLTLMILGVYLGDIRIGNSPFTFTRNEITAPIFARADYLNFLQDGMGLNVLLRNYWMVIHPPVLFLGFASTIIPAAFAWGGFVRKTYGEWVKPALSWALFSLLVLGVGIMMGGKWAYESLSFGGYWAWDPVENASFVPWLLLVAGIHTMLIYKSTGRSLKASYIFIALSFIFILYSTFLTRTGILGDTSVHAFTEAGSVINILIGAFVLFYFFLLAVPYFFHTGKIPVMHEEETTDSREFWMLLGSLLIFLTAMYIILVTSLPVYNKTPGIKTLIASWNGGPLASPEDPEFQYNKVMILVAILLGVFTGITQFFRYKKTPRGAFFRPLIIPIILSLLMAGCLMWLVGLDYRQKGMGFLIALYAGFFSLLFSIVANAHYLAAVLKGRLAHAGGSITHIGFGIMIAGMIFTSSNKKTISDSRVNGINLPVGVDPMTKKKDDPKENLTLLRSIPTMMGEYRVTYEGDSTGHEATRVFYKLRFENTRNQSVFYQYPDVYLMKDNSMSSNPDTRSY
ncbi:MAG: cytochrome c biogenesis protein CcsA, partial [Ferruginibacter sp.]